MVSIAMKNPVKPNPKALRRSRARLLHWAFARLRVTLTSHRNGQWRGSLWRDVGEHLLGRLKGVRERHSTVGDVRGRGLFLGVELVRDRETLEPAREEAEAVVEAMKQRGVLLSTDGPLHNVIKIKPPLVFSEKDADELADGLDEVLSALPD